MNDVRDDLSRSSALSFARGTRVTFTYEERAVHHEGRVILALGSVPGVPFEATSMLVTQVGTIVVVARQVVVVDLDGGRRVALMRGAIRHAVAV